VPGSAAAKPGAKALMATRKLAARLANTYVITYIHTMKVATTITTITTITVSQARANLFKLLDQAASSHEPIRITGRRNDGVLISEEDFRAIQETLYLLGVPGMRESLTQAKKAPLRSYSRKRPW